MNENSLIQLFTWMLLFMWNFFLISDRKELVLQSPLTTLNQFNQWKLCATFVHILLSVQRWTNILLTAHILSHQFSQFKSEVQCLECKIKNSPDAVSEFYIVQLPNRSDIVITMSEKMFRVFYKPERIGDTGFRRSFRAPTVIT